MVRCKLTIRIRCFCISNLVTTIFVEFRLTMILLFYSCLFNSSFNQLTKNYDDYYPVDLKNEIDHFNNKVYPAVNNGVYRTGFAQTQKAYDEAVRFLFDTLDELDEVLSKNKYLTGDKITGDCLPYLSEKTTPTTYVLSCFNVCLLYSS